MIDTNKLDMTTMHLNRYALADIEGDKLIIKSSKSEKAGFSIKFHDQTFTKETFDL